MTLEELIEKYQGKKHKSLRRIGGGFYADVYRADYDGECIIVKSYKRNGIMSGEISQVEVLSRYAIFPMPEFLWVHKSDDIFSQDVLAMKLLPGQNGGGVFYLKKSKRAAIAEQVIDNLIAFHSVRNSEGFGEIGSAVRYATFNEYYKARAGEILSKAEKLFEKRELDSYVLDVMKKAYESFDKIFYLPITEASLIHGDYNMWNILIDRKDCTVSAVIDPCGCMWGDSEYDLYQLNNANGKYYRLLDTYRKKRTLSENFNQKMAFYELFTEIEHYFNSGHPVQETRTKKRAQKLEKYT